MSKTYKAVEMAPPKTKLRQSKKQRELPPMEVMKYRKTPRGKL